MVGGIFHPPIGSIYTTYIPLIVLVFWGVICYRSHPLQEPEKSIDRILHQPEGVCPNMTSGNPEKEKKNNRKEVIREKFPRVEVEMDGTLAKNQLVNAGFRKTINPTIYRYLDCEVGRFGLWCIL